MRHRAADHRTRGLTVLRGFVRASAALNRALAGVAGAALVATMLILVTNVVLRLVADPITGTYELISLTAALAFALSLGDAQTHQSHVSIDVVVGRFRKGVRLVLGALVAAASAVLFVQLATSLVVYGLNLYAEGAATDAFEIPVWIPVMIIVLGVAGLVVALVADVAKAWLARSSDDPHLNIF